jgi:hypothetical protein
MYRLIKTIIIFKRIGRTIEIPVRIIPVYADYIYFVDLPASERAAGGKMYQRGDYLVPCSAYANNMQLCHTNPLLW